MCHKENSSNCLVFRSGLRNRGGSTFGAFGDGLRFIRRFSFGWGEGCVLNCLDLLSSLGAVVCGGITIFTRQAFSYSFIFSIIKTICMKYTKIKTKV